VLGPQKRRSSHTCAAMCASSALISSTSLQHTQSFLPWDDQLALMLVDRSAHGVLPHPYLAVARQHYRSTDGRHLSAAEAATMLKAARRRGCELLEVAVLTHRRALLTLKPPAFIDMQDLTVDGFLHHAQARFWQSDAERAAHTDVLRAIQWSQFGLLAAAARCDRTIDSMTEVSVLSYDTHRQRVLSSEIQHRDAQAEDVVLRTTMPHGYVYVFVCVLVYYRLAGRKQLELLAAT
jgi:hypothetical protein